MEPLHCITQASDAAPIRRLAIGENSQPAMLFIRVVATHLLAVNPRTLGFTWTFRLDLECGCVSRRVNVPYVTAPSYAPANGVENTAWDRN
jgi:hypothetical protein